MIYLHAPIHIHTVYLMLYPTHDNIKQCFISNVTLLQHTTCHLDHLPDTCRIHKLSKYATPHHPVIQNKSVLCIIAPIVHQSNILQYYFHSCYTTPKHMVMWYVGPPIICGKIFNLLLWEQAYPFIYSSLLLLANPVLTTPNWSWSLTKTYKSKKIQNEQPFGDTVGYGDSPPVISLLVANMSANLLFFFLISVALFYFVIIYS